MGNLSSSFKIQNLLNSDYMAKLVDSQGQLRLVTLPTLVGELMLENPGFALTPVEELRKTHRLSAMRADDTLLGRKVYLLVPVDKVNCRLTDLQLAAVDSLVCSNNKVVGGRTRGSPKLSPLLLGSTNMDVQSLEDVSGNSSNVIGQRRRFCKGWKPVLEPILEECQFRSLSSKLFGMSTRLVG